MQKISGAVLRCKILKLGWISSELFAASSKGHGPNMCKLEFFLSRSSDWAKSRPTSRRLPEHIQDTS